MFNAKVLAVKNLMVVGKLLILLSGSLVLATTAQAGSGPLESPTFYSYSATTFENRLVEMTFGWFRTLDRSQKEAYNQAVTHAVMYAENGETVQWFRGDASGYAVPVMTWPTHSGGYCRRIHVQTIAYNREKTQTVTACFNAAKTSWRWVNDK